MTRTQTEDQPKASTEGGHPDSALDGLQVVELTSGVAGAYCGKLLADFGADVIKVELPEGDPTRSVGPFPEAGDDAGALFLWLNVNKRGITLDWRRPAGRRVLRELLTRADVVLEDASPAALGRYRLGPASLLRLSSRLIVTSVTPFGATGPWRDRPAVDLTISALGGMSSVNGSPGRTPLKEPGPQMEALAGAYACMATLTALANREVTGEGQAVDVSALESAVATLTPYVTQYSYQGVAPQRGRGGDTIFACQDGHVGLYAWGANPWEFLAQLLDLEDQDPLLSTPASRLANPARMREALEPLLAGHPRSELFETAAAARINVGMVLSVADLKRDRHLQQRAFFRQVADPRAGEIVYPGPPFQMENGARRVSRPAPRLGEHTDEVLGSFLGYSSRRRIALRRAGVTT